MSVLLGPQMTILYDASLIAYAQDFDFTVNREVIDITTLSSGYWKEHMVNMKDWSISFNGLVTSTDASDVSIGYDGLLYDIKNQSSSITVGIKPNASGNKYETGKAFLSTLSMSGTVDGAVTFSGEVVGTADLSTYTV